MQKTSYEHNHKQYTTIGRIKQEKVWGKGLQFGIRG